MPGYGTAFGRGLMLGVGAALLYAAARENAASRALPERDGHEHLIDWDWATRVAVRTAGRTPTLHPGARAQLRAEYLRMLEEIEQPIASYTGSQLSLAGTSVEVLDRAGWIVANMGNFRDLLQPIEEF